MIRSKRNMSVAAKSFALLVGMGVSSAAIAQKIPPHKSAIVLFNGKDLNNFDTFLKTKGLNSDPDHVFQVENGIIHISCKEMGYIITKVPYHDYYLRAEFKWGEGTYGERAGKARDSGILYNIQGDQKVWPRSIEFQITEGGTGDFWLTDGAALTGRDGKRVTGPPGSALVIPHFNKGTAPNVTGTRDPTGELEKPHGQWNRLELVSQGGHIWQYVNGKLANEGTDAFPADGKILFQSEGAEVFFRNMKLYPLR